MDSLIDEVLNGGGDSGWQKVSKKIADIETYTCGLDREENFKKQVYSRLMKAGSTENSKLFDKLSQCKDCIDDKIFLPLIAECLKDAHRNTSNLRTNFQRYFDITVRTGSLVSANYILGFPIRNPFFPERFSGVNDLAKFFMEHLAEDEQVYLSRINVEAFPEEQKYWASLCRCAAESEITSKAAEREATKKTFDANVATLSKKFERSVAAIAKRLGQLVVLTSDGTSITDDRLVPQLAAQIMELARSINSTDQTDGDVVKAMVTAAVCNNFQICEGVRERAVEVVGDGSNWKEKIKKEMDAMNAQQIEKGKSVFNFNPRSISNPVGPKALVDMIFEASLRG
jgi:hypothetical protein